MYIILLSCFLLPLSRWRGLCNNDGIPVVWDLWRDKCFSNVGTRNLKWMLLNYKSLPKFALQWAKQPFCRDTTQSSARCLDPTSSLMYWMRKGEALRLSTGKLKKPWISFWWRSIVMMWVSPATASHTHTHARRGLQSFLQWQSHMVFIASLRLLGFP